MRKHSAKQIEKFLPELIHYIKRELGYNQEDIATLTKISPGKISDLKNSNEREFKPTDREFTNKILDVFSIEIEFEPQLKFNVEDRNKLPSKIRKKRNYSSVSENTTSYFLTPKGNKWKIYAQIGNEIGIRYLTINQSDCEYIINTRSHDDYIGTFRFNKIMSEVIFELNTKQTGRKELYIRFWIGDKSSEPEVMLGVLVYSTFKGYIAAHSVVAINISESEEEMKTQLVKMENFQDEKILSYFKIKNNNFYSASGIITDENLNNYIAKKRKV